MDIGSCFLLELHPNSVIISNNNIDFITIYLLETTYFSIIGTYSIILKLQSSKPDCYPQYAIFVDEEKGDYEYTHLWFRDRKAFDYFSIHSYYSTKENIYLVGSKGEEVCIYCYNKQEKNVR